MSLTTATANPRARNHVELPHENLLTREQIRAVDRLPRDHELVGVRGRTPIVRRPDGQLSRMRSSGRLVRTGGVKASQSYLLVSG
jgi:hypothetical protein